MNENCQKDLSFLNTPGKILPLSTSDFIALRLSKIIYVDKTDMIFSLAGARRKVFLSRPRRFGKSLLVSTLQTLFRDGLQWFQGRRRLTRNGRAASRNFCNRRPWTEKGTYRVVKLVLTCFDGCTTKEQLEISFRERVLSAFELGAGFRLDPGIDRTWTSQLGDWLAIQKPCSIVLLVDEYDAGLGARLHDSEGFESVLGLLSSFFPWSRTLTLHGALSSSPASPAFRERASSPE